MYRSLGRGIFCAEKEIRPLKGANALFIPSFANSAGRRYTKNEALFTDCDNQTKRGGTMAYRILAIDDDESVLRLIQNILHLAGYEVEDGVEVVLALNCVK